MKKIPMEIYSGQIALMESPDASIGKGIELCGWRDGFVTLSIPRIVDEPILAGEVHREVVAVMTVTEAECLQHALQAATQAARLMRGAK